MDSKVRNIRYKPSDVQLPQLVTNKPRLINPYNPQEETGIIREHHGAISIVNPINHNHNPNPNTNTITKLKRLFGF